jgi:hypothetical protein
MRITGQEMSYCRTCTKPTLQIYNEDRCSHILHLLLSVFTAGLWLPIWLCCALSAGRGDPTCTVCGTKNDRGDKPPKSEQELDHSPIYGKNPKPTRLYEWLNKH